MAALGALAGLWSIYQGYKSASDYRSAGRKSKQLAERQALLQEESTAEEARRMGNLQDMTQSRAAALAAASGIDSGTGSMGNYLAEMKTEDTAQLDWLKRAGASKAAIMRWGGDLAKRRSKSAARGAISSGWTSGLSSIGMAWAGANAPAAAAGTETVGWFGGLT
jgi:hypothetical protein